jgi:hypothetical protein
MASAKRTKNHEEIRKWAEDRGGIPTVVKGTEGLLRIDFIRGGKSGGREQSLEEVDWDRWFEIFDDNDLSFLHSPEKDSRFFKLVSAAPGERGSQKHEQRREGGHKQASSDSNHEQTILVSKEGNEWLVEIEHDGHRKTYRTKADAVHHARELARTRQPAELIIETVEGEEESHVHYGR